MAFPFVVFIIPTIGRATLKKALNSLLQQTDTDWAAFVVSDGVELKDSICIRDPRIFYNKVSKRGTFGSNHGNAGMVRNVALEHKKLKGEWIGFLDDDDILLPNYVSNLRQEASKYSPDVVITRMSINDQIIPMPGLRDFRKNDVGISFAVKSYIFKELGFKFKQMDSEDYELLNDFRLHGLNIHMSDYVGYHVGSSTQENFKITKTNHNSCNIYVLIICIVLLVLVVCLLFWRTH